MTDTTSDAATRADLLRSRASRSRSKRTMGNLLDTLILLAFCGVVLFLATPLDAQIRRDHQLHAMVGAGVYAGSRAVGMRPGSALTACAAAGLLKEAYDSTGRGNVEAGDVIATVLPCLLFWAIETPDRRPQTVIDDLRAERHRVVSFYRRIRN